jgi:tRNA nucleotidyltransferase (CCA-adding enzyme)
VSTPSRLAIPDAVLAIARALEDAGYETWCVGGAIRDTLLGLDNSDFDLATAARPEDVQRLFRRTVPVGVEHGTVAVLDRDNRPHEVTTFRRDVLTDGRHATVEFGVSVDQDLARRDFTINAIGYHPFRDEWRDPFGGREDIGRKIMRAVGDPAARFREDYLRILRLLRFAARFGFAMDRATWEAAVASAAGLEHLSAERVRDEWFKGLESATRPGELARLWEAVGGLRRWLPEASSGGAGFAGLDRLPRDPVLLTSYVSSDPEATMRRLKCSRAEIERARRLAAHRNAWPDPGTPVSVRRWMAQAGPAVDDLVWFAKAQGYPEGLERAVADIRASGAALAVSSLAVSGGDLLAAGIPPGPAVGQSLRRLLDAVIEQPELNTRESLLRLAARRGAGESTGAP